jgi:hypothetical protein
LRPEQTGETRKPDCPKAKVLKASFLSGVDRMALMVPSLPENDYAALLREAAISGIQGGTIYDALLLKCAEVSGADRIYTLNLKHFQALAGSETLKKLAEP